jgi:hypothetical protein
MIHDCNCAGPQDVVFMQRNKGTRFAMSIFGQDAGLRLKVKAASFWPEFWSAA